MRSLSNNLHQFIDMPHIIALSETWLSPSILDSELDLIQYNVFRHYRINNQSERGGGVLLAVINNIKCKLIHSNINFQESDHLFLVILTSSSKWIVTVSYFTSLL